MKKISIVLEKNLSPGQKSNVAAIIMGQIAKDMPSIYDEKVIDQSKIEHAGIAVNVVILDGGSGQLLTLVESGKSDEVYCVAFSSTGQALSNSYPEYQQKISLMDSKSTGIIGVGIVGDESVVKPLTKKFSLTK